jgi:hypothetical protein
MTHRHPKDNMPIPTEPWPADGSVGEAEGQVLERSRTKEGEPLQPPDEPVQDSKPFKNLTTGR